MGARGNKWLHAIVVMGTSLTACGGRIAQDDGEGPIDATVPDATKPDDSFDASTGIGGFDASYPPPRRDGGRPRDAGVAVDAGFDAAACMSQPLFACCCGGVPPDASAECLACVGYCGCIR